MMRMNPITHGTNDIKIIEINCVKPADSPSV